MNIESVMQLLLPVYGAILLFCVGIIFAASYGVWNIAHHEMRRILPEERVESTAEDLALISFLFFALVWTAAGVVFHNISTLVVRAYMNSFDVTLIITLLVMMMTTIAGAHSANSKWRERRWLRLSDPSKRTETPESSVSKPTKNLESEPV